MEQGQKQELMQTCESEESIKNMHYNVSLKYDMLLDQVLTIIWADNDRKTQTHGAKDAKGA